MDALLLEQLIARGDLDDRRDAAARAHREDEERHGHVVQGYGGWNVYYI